eukprot:354892-Chlamydomonas_euryale.AAC.5
MQGGHPCACHRMNKTTKGNPRAPPLWLPPAPLCLQSSGLVYAYACLNHASSPGCGSTAMHAPSPCTSMYASCWGACSAHHGAMPHSHPSRQACNTVARSCCASATCSHLSLMPNTLPNWPAMHACMRTCPSSTHKEAHVPHGDAPSIGRCMHHASAPCTTHAHRMRAP